MGARGWGVRHRAAPLDENVACVDRFAVELTPKSSAHGAQVRARLQPFPSQDRLSGVRAACDDVSAAHRFLE